jgi:catechol 2,3-dioxygenase-like lactoylglutathione lyase family enzyme
VFERYSFVAVTTRDLRRARSFWVEQLGCPVTEEASGEFFIVDAGGLRLCVDLPDGDVHVPGGSDPVIGFRVRSVDDLMQVLSARGLAIHKQSAPGGRRRWVEVRDPDGRPVIFTETD